jgi:hypothetical protein
MSIKSAPAAIITSAIAMASFADRNLPPSENESGVAFNMPITIGRVSFEKSKRKRPQRQVEGMPFITILSVTD